MRLPDRSTERSADSAMALAIAAIGMCALVLCGIGVWCVGITTGERSARAAVALSDLDTRRSLDFWTTDQMRHARSADGTRTSRDPAPAAAPPTALSPPPAVHAQPVARPYTQPPARYVGRLFAAIGATATLSCSATVVDSANRSTLWTAGHCVHGGRGKDWYQNLVFVPDYDAGGDVNDSAALAPFGRWPVSYAATSDDWRANGDSQHSVGDYAALTVRPDAQGRRIEDVVGAAPILFDAPRGVAITAYGFPAEPPYSGNELYDCASPSAEYRSTADPGPDLVWIGCDLTPGVSGGGWFATVDGRTYLVSNFSMWSPTQGHFGPYLAEDARTVYDRVATR